jgi:hypothetical protein
MKETSAQVVFKGNTSVKALGTNVGLIIQNVDIQIMLIPPASLFINMTIRRRVEDQSII